MELLLEGLKKAIEMILSGDREILEITLLTLRVSITAVLISTMIGIPAGMFLGLARFPGRKLLLAIINIGMGLPPVVAGLWITLFLWRSGPLGDLAWLYTPTAIIMAQILVSLPIVTALTSTAFQQINPKLILQVKALGATKFQLYWILMKEVKLAILAAIIAGFGRVIAEVGAAMMVGGNLSGETRILTTSIVMEVSKGNFDIALALSFILMTLAFIITFSLTYLQQRKRSL
ncbi:ABC transporter permease [Mesobacillus sp. AQ2]|jgi:tungstate transport system permease protein|uniref:ABC transporter permease n=1 Tax=Bacillaceae TaxID=186817 RepID=UPI0011A54F24|nr:MULTISPECIES: ABC transporter permease [Bacillaceae]MBT2703989.1 ABC transporter permease [Chryseobacterium sp. ISL-80]MBT2678992.1 ABC transporter permease [Bacillus sp. ISL-35]MCM3123987.1 ABC transporter permease [Mesobacillus sp. MER 33]MCM3233836.1 ABC transporter permease [Mesobacillus sp. MER 48]WHX40088.1 ABC transporter permease [Mesobacillus sp. AQ2]